MTKSKDEILLFLVRNSVPEYYSPLSDNSSPEEKSLSLQEKIKAFLLRVSGVNRFVCESAKLEEFLGEKISFAKHLRPLCEEGTLFFSGIPKPGDFYDSESYRKVFDSSWGQVKNYQTEICYVNFWYRENNFLEDYNLIANDVLKLNIFRKRDSKKKKVNLE